MNILQHFKEQWALVGDKVKHFFLSFLIVILYAYVLQKGTGILMNKALFAGALTSFMVGVAYEIAGNKGMKDFLADMFGILTALFLCGAFF